MPKSKEPSFEATIAELEALVARMESGDLPLDEALRSFERGIKLTRECQAALQTAQQRVQILTQRPGGPSVEEFSPDNAPDEPRADP